MIISIVGTGYVGLTTGIALAFLGHRVTCLDTDAGKIDVLRAGRLPIYEPGLDDLLDMAAGRISFTTDYASAIPTSDIVFIAVGTPPQSDGSPDLCYLRSAASGIAEHLGNHFTVVVNKSTVPVGSGNLVDSLVRDAYAASHGHQLNGHFAVASNPEFLREGSAVHDSLYPDRVVIGADDPRAAAALHELYRPVLEQTFDAPARLPRPAGFTRVPLVSTDLASAELIKYAANAFLALKISYINEIGRLAESVGADISQVAEAIGLDARIGARFLQPGLGWGGSCFGKDTAALVSTAAEYSLDMPIVRAAREANYCQRVRVVEKLLAELKILRGRTIGLLGLAFKPDTDDIRDAPALDVARRLIQRGARVKAHDPVALCRARRENIGSGIQFCETPEETAEGADALVLVTEWREYRGLEWGALAPTMRNALILDGRHVLDPSQLRAGGFRLIRI
jgi:UDPglucose 6-dehydrogenase